MVSDYFSASNLRSVTNGREKETKEQFLRFHLVPDTKVMLPVVQVNEVLTVPLGNIIPIPHMPSWVMGVYNWRGEILWMVDLGRLVGLTPWHEQTVNSSSYKSLVLNSTSSKTKQEKNIGEMLGLVVTRVEDIEWCNPDEIQSPPSSAVTPELTPFLRGYWVKTNGDMLITLDGEAIMAAMPKP